MGHPIKRFLSITRMTLFTVPILVSSFLGGLILGPTPPRNPRPPRPALPTLL